MPDKKITGKKTAFHLNMLPLIPERLRTDENSLLVRFLCFSSIIWSSYHKGMLASSDYEGTVTLWDAFTGTKTRLFQVGRGEKGWIKIKVKDGLLPSSEYMEFVCSGVHHTYIHAYVRTYVRTYVHTYIHTYIHAYMHTCKYANMHTCIHAIWQTR